MRMQRTNSPRGKRRALTTAATCAAIGGLMLATSGTAAASSVSPPDPDSCSGEVQGTSGDTVAVTGASLADGVRDGAQQAKDDRLIPGLSAISPDDLADMIEGEPIDVGEVGSKAESSVSGDQIGQQAVEKLEDAGLWQKRHLGALIHKRGEVLDHIKDSVADQCDLTVVNTDKAGSSESAKSTGSSGSKGSSSKSTSDEAGAAKGTGKAKQGSGDGTAPPRDYSNIPSASAPSVKKDGKKGGSSAKMGDPSKMDAPPKASLPQDRLGSGKAGNNKQGADSAHSKVANAGKADALHGQSGPERVQVPMLLAVVALALATAGLVRSWVLRRT